MPNQFTNIVLENYAFNKKAIRVVGEDTAVIEVHPDSDYRTKEAAGEIGVELVKRWNMHDNLLSIAKRCAFIFGNEANYPEGTQGYRIAQECKQLIQEAK